MKHRRSIRWRTFGIVALLLLVGVAAAVMIDRWKPRFPTQLQSARNGLIAYSFKGDIFLGDPVTGTTTAIATGPESDVNAIFSPDGARIAFVRGDPYGLASLVVVRPFIAPGQNWRRPFGGHHQIWRHAGGDM